MEFLIVGFTGTRKGGTEQQHIACAQLMNCWIERWGRERMEVTHGGALGADNEFDDICRALNVGRVVRPASRPGVSTQQIFMEYQVWMAGANILGPKPPLDRDRDIAAVCNVLMAMPKGFSEERRSGTWATVRYAVKDYGKPAVVLWPDGTYSMASRSQKRGGFMDFLDVQIPFIGD